MKNFVAIDFETADHGHDSACAIGIVRVEGGRITESTHYLIRPPRRDFMFTYVHGITWDDVKDEPTFAELWPEIGRKLAGAHYLAAHNKGFDRTVLRVCCENAGVEMPSAPFICTVQASRKILDIRPATLDNVCRVLRIKLKHHDPLSDANACARIVLKARETDQPAFDKFLECL
ncbi:3'-5' exonuclease [bacterium]|nr:3'-5' exonuclease [bacterium]MBU3956051.1 3'-5' exonuclease [bacterium]